MSQDSGRNLRNKNNNIYVVHFTRTGYLTGFRYNKTILLYLSLCHRETQRNSSCRFGAVRCLSFREKDFLLYFEHYWGCIQAHRFWWLYWVYWIQGIKAAQQPLKYLLTELLSVFVLWEAISLSVVTYDKVETRDWCMWCFLTFLSTD